MAQRKILASRAENTAHAALNISARGWLGSRPRRVRGSVPVHVAVCVHGWLVCVVQQPRWRHAAALCQHGASEPECVSGLAFCIVCVQQVQPDPDDASKLSGDKLQEYFAKLTYKEAMVGLAADGARFPLIPLPCCSGALIRVPCTVSGKGSCHAPRVRSPWSRAVIAASPGHRTRTTGSTLLGIFGVQANHNDIVVCGVWCVWCVCVSVCLCGGRGWQPWTSQQVVEKILVPLRLEKYARLVDPGVFFVPP